MVFFDKNNAPSPVDLDKKSLGQNASQSLCLIRNVPFIFWRYRNEPDLVDHWMCIESLLRIIEIVYSRELNDDDVITLTQEVRRLCTIIGRLGHNFIPKIHFLLHYPRVIRLMGPIVFMSMLRYDRKHHELKQLSTRNFKNINQSIAYKHQELLCMRGISMADDVEFGASSPVTDDEKESLEKHFALNISEIYEVKSMTINNYNYRKNLFITHESNMYQIENVLIADSQKYLRCWPFEIVQFHCFLNSYEIKKKMQSAS